VHSQHAMSRLPELSAHPDLQNLLWWVDGPYRNYTPTKSIQHINVNDMIFEISLTGMHEPSLLSVNAAVKVDADPASVDRLPYYPAYSELQPEQKGVYWQFLLNPYSGLSEIGYVFILYYGLERHLLKGDYEKAFHVILKLRDVYSNSSFQNYSGCALIVACTMHNRIDLLSEFFASLDKGYELKFPANLYLLGKYGLGIPLYSQDIMRMAKDFEFSNLNYIKKYPEIFEQVLQEQMQSRYGLAQLDISSFVGASEWKKAPRDDVLAFANVSIESRTIPVPQIIDIFKFKKAVYDLLEVTHDAVKAHVALQRKEGRLPTAKATPNSAPKKILTFDADIEKTLMGQYHDAGDDPVVKARNIEFGKQIREINPELASILDDQDKQLAQIQAAEEGYKANNDVEELIGFWESIWAAGGLKFNGSHWTFRLPDLYIKVKRYDDALSILNKINKPEYQDKAEKYRERIAKKTINTRG